MNPKKGKIIKNFWFKNEKEYQELINAIEQNKTDEVLDLIWLLYSRGDL